MSFVPPPEWLIVSAGLSQILLSLASLAIPGVLGWREQTQVLRPLTRQVFWTYAGYIWASNLSFGLLSVFLPGALTAPSPLAAAVNGFIALWWTARLVIQFTYFDRTDAPSGFQYQLAEAALVLLFVGLMLIYGYAALANAWAVP